MPRPLAAARVRLVGVLALAATIAISLVTAAPAHAHTDLAGSTPEPGETVEELDRVEVAFTGNLLDIGAELVLTDGAGERHELEVEFPSQMAVAADVADAAPGSATLAWRVVAEDGHPLEGTIDFTISGPAVDPGEPTASAAPTPEETPSTAATAPEPDASAVPGAGDASAESDDGSAAWWIVAAVMAIVIVAGLLAWLASRRSGSGTSAGGDAE